MSDAGNYFFLMCTSSFACLHQFRPLNIYITDIAFTAGWLVLPCSLHEP